MMRNITSRHLAALTTLALAAAAFLAPSKVAAQASPLSVLEVYGSTRGWQIPGGEFIYLQRRTDAYPGVATVQVDCPLGYKPLSCTGHCWEGTMTSLWTYSRDENYLPQADVQRGGFCRVSCRPPEGQAINDLDMEIQLNCVAGVQIQRVGFGAPNASLPEYTVHPFDLAPNATPTPSAGGGLGAHGLAGAAASSGVSYAPRLRQHTDF